MQSMAFKHNTFPHTPPVYIVGPKIAHFKFSRELAFRLRVNARPVCPPKENKRDYAFIFAIFTVLAPFGPFIDVYSFFCVVLCFSKLFERFMWFHGLLPFFLFWLFCLI